MGLNAVVNTQSEDRQGLLIQYIEHSAQYEEVVGRAKIKHQSSSTKKSQEWHHLKRFLVNLGRLLVADVNDFSGKAIVTQELAASAKVTARVVTVSNSIDFCFNFPFFVYAFRFLGPIPSVLASLAISIGVLKFGNDTAAAVASRQSSNRFWSHAAFLCLVLINLVQSVASGIGTELFGNQMALSQLKASELVEQRLTLAERSIEEMQVPSSEEYRNAASKCEEGERQLSNLPRDDPKWHATYVELYGRWSEQDRDWSRVASESLPSCRKVDRLLAEVSGSSAYQNAQGQFSEAMSKRAEIGSDLFFLKEQYPPIYALHFDESGELKSGIEAVRLATLNFLGKLQQGDFSGLGFSLFIFSISSITSLAACLLTAFHALNPETQMSRSSMLLCARNEWCEEQRHQQLIRQQRELAELEALLSSTSSE